MKKNLLLIYFILISTAAHSQSNMMLIPRNVYVGDPAVLILSLPSSSQNVNDIVLIPGNPGFPYDPDIDFHKILLERRLNGDRLIIEFTPFMPGRLMFPEIIIGEEEFAGLVITVNSVIGSQGSALELSQPASSLAMPGTALMLYGTMAALVFLLLLIIWFILKGRFLLEKLALKFQRWKYFRFIKTNGKSLHRLLLNGANTRVILDRLSLQFRIFLSFITGCNCRAMTACEFDGLSDTCTLVDFFRRLDDMRFSGMEIKKDDVFRLLNEMHAFVLNAEKAGKGAAA